MGITANTNFVSFGIYDGGGNNAITSQNLSDGLWHYVVGVRESSTGTNYVYVDGVLKAQAVYNNTQPFNTSNASYAIGNVSSNYTGEPFFGNIAQVSIYNRALSAAEISQNFNALSGRFSTVIVNSNLGTTGIGIYYATATISGKRVDWFAFNSSASNVISQLSSKGITATNCYRVATNFNTIVINNVPSGTQFLSWGAAGTSVGSDRNAGPGGYSTGILSSALTTVTLILGQGGINATNAMSGWGYGFGGGGYDSTKTYSARGGGFSAIFDGEINYSNYFTAPSSNPFGGGLSVATAQSKLVLLSGGGGSAGGNYLGASGGNYGGGGGGTTGGTADGYGAGGTGGTQSAGGANGGLAFLGGAGSSNPNHGIVAGGGGYYGGGGARFSGPYNYPGSGGGSGYVNSSYLTSTTLTTATNNQLLPPQTTSPYYIGNYGYANLSSSIPQPSIVTSSAITDGNHGLIVIVYP